MAVTHRKPGRALSIRVYSKERLSKDNEALPILASSKRRHEISLDFRISPQIVEKHLADNYNVYLRFPIIPTSTPCTSHRFDPQSAESQGVHNTSPSNVTQRTEK